MDNEIWIATIAALALGIGLVLVAIYFKNQTPTAGMQYNYDNENRLQSITPTTGVTLRQIK